MERVTRRRMAQRLRFNKQRDELKLLLEAKPIDAAKIQVKFRMFEISFHSLEEMNVEVLDLMLDEGKTAEEVEKEMVEIGAFSEEFYSLDTKVTVLNSPHLSDPAPSICPDGRRKTYQLPKLEMRMFGGDLKEWLGFWSQWQKYHLDNEMGDGYKYDLLLQTMVTGSEPWQIVDAYPHTGDNYMNAINALKQRFGREDLLLQVYVRELLQMVIGTVQQQEQLSLSTMYLKLQSHLRALQSLKLEDADPATWIFPLVESSLPEELLKIWQRSPESKRDGRKEDPKKTRLDILMEFLKNEVEAQQCVDLAKSGFGTIAPKSGKGVSSSSAHQGKGRKSVDPVPATAAGLLNTDFKSNTCVFCDGSHKSHLCRKAAEMSTEERNKVIKEKRACFKCLKRGHMKSQCQTAVQCGNCQGAHFKLLCLGLKKAGSDGSGSTASSSQNPVAEVRTSGQSNVTCSSDVLLKTAVVYVQPEEGGKKLRVRLLLDDGCQRSCVSSRAVKLTGSQPIKEELHRCVLFDGSVTPTKKTAIHRVKVSSIFDVERSTVIEVRERAKLGGSMSRVPAGRWLSELEAVGFQISDSVHVPVQDEAIDIVIGSDYWGTIVEENLKKLSNGLLATPTIFGWMISGPVPDGRSQAAETIHMYLGEQEVTKLWNLELIGIRDDPTVVPTIEKEAKAEQFFQDTVSREVGGRYVVRLPWVSNEVKAILPQNRFAAERRMNSTARRLEKAGKFEDYSKLFETWLEEGLIEEVKDSAGDGHYLPHHPVFKENSTTPVRPVFDASCKMGRAPSLNDCLHKGPNYIELLPSALLRFREKRIGVIADIRKAFQMITVHEEDRKYLRFLWWTDSSKSAVRVFQHRRVVFGVNCSPYLLAAVLKVHLMQTAVTEDYGSMLVRSLYVDNVCASVESAGEYEALRKDFSSKLLDAEMELRGWESTFPEGSGNSLSMPSSFTMDGSEDKSISNVLGMKWNKITDVLSLSMDKIRVPEKVTMRSALALLHQIFDPIGVFCPVMIKPKMIIQEGWGRKIGWDGELPKELKDDYVKWSSTIEDLAEVKIPRSLNGAASQKREIHTFCDASQDAYAAVVFIRNLPDSSGVGSSSEGCGLGEGVKWTVQLAMAKARISPQKKITIPRLELMSCLIAAQLTKHVMEALGYQDIPTFYWSDSSTALAWIKRNDEWGTFVGNRVKKILSTTSSTQWSHIAGKDNPADLPSRGCDAKKLLELRWWEGPAWLKRDSTYWPSQPVPEEEEEILSEKRKTSSALFVAKTQSWFNCKFGSFVSNVRVMAWLLRGMVAKARRRTGMNLSVSEMKMAETKLLKLIQDETFGYGQAFGKLNVITMEDGLLHVKTAMVNRDDTEGFRFPVLLPKRHPLVDSLIMEAHKTFCHAGAQFLMGMLREKYWILQSRRSISRVIHSCVRCRRFDAKPMEVIPAALPQPRVTCGEVFRTTGVDLAGPLYLKDGSKVWIVLFTCAVYRAVHLDLVTSLQTASFVAVLERFVFLYGRPNTIYSDNGTNFVGASNLFKKLDWSRIEAATDVRKMKWIFNAPTAAWWGGWWERLVRTVKDLLKRMIPKNLLSYEELRNCLAAVAYVVNERPLTTMNEDWTDLRPLTPAVFLRGTRGALFPEASEIGAADLRRQHQKILKLREDLQARFRKEYLAQLVQRYSEPKKDVECKEGLLVLVGDHNRKRFEWPLGRIQKLIPGKDGHVRTAEVITAKGVLKRPVQNLYPLEMGPEDIAVAEDNIVPESSHLEEKDQVESPSRTRFGRNVLKPKRYGAWNN